VACSIKQSIFSILPEVLVLLHKPILVRKAAGARPTVLNVLAKRVKSVIKARRGRPEDDTDPEEYNDGRWKRLNARLYGHKDFSYILCPMAPRYVICTRCNMLRARYATNHGNLQKHKKSCHPARAGENMTNLPKKLEKELDDVTRPHIKFIIGSVGEDIEAARLLWDKIVSARKDIESMRDKDHINSVELTPS